MRRHDIVSGILFILSIIDFQVALAAPVSAQEKRQPCVDIVHIPNDVMDVLGKRAGESDDEIEKLMEKYFKTSQEPVKSSDTSASQSSAPPGPDHGSANVAQAPIPAQNPATSTANLNPLKEPSGSSSTAPMQGGDELHGSPQPPALTGYGSAHELTGADATQPNPNKRPLTDPDPDFDWDSWMEIVNRPSPKRPKLSGLAYENQLDHVQQPGSGWSSSSPEPVSPSSWPSSPEGSSPEELTDSEFEVTDMNALPSYLPPKEFDQSHEYQYYQVGHVQQPSLAGPPTDSELSLVSPEVLGQAHADQVEDVQYLNPGPSTQPEPKVANPPSLDPGPPPDEPEREVDNEDPQAVRYAMKGKAKVPGSARDVESVANRESEPAERSLDPGE